MDALARAGAHAVTMAQVEAAWDPRDAAAAQAGRAHVRRRLPRTVDNALPVMRRHGWPGVLYMCIANFRPATGLTEKDVRTLLRADWELGAHTFSHSDLRALGAPELRHEVGGSRTWLERRFGVRVNSFAYPAGMYDRPPCRPCVDAHFHTAVTVAPGLAKRDHPLELNRIRVNRGMTASMLVSELRGLGWRLTGLPARGAAVRGLGLPLPPQRMPRRQGARPLKRWRYVGVYGPDLMLCVGEARVGPMPQRWWAVALPDGTLRQQTTLGRGGVELSPGHASVDSRTCACAGLRGGRGSGDRVTGRAQLDLDPQARRPARDRVCRARRPSLRDRRRGGGRRERGLPRAPHRPGAGRPG